MWFQKMKMCDNCKHIEIIKRIKTVESFFAILDDLEKLVSNGEYEYDGGNNPRKTIRYWYQDGLWYQMKCKKCGTKFNLWYDTFTNRGTLKIRK